MADELLSDDPANVVLSPVKRKKGAKTKAVNVSRGIVHVHATFNNTKVSITDTNGNVIAWATGGKVGFKGSRKSTAFAAQRVSETAARRAMEHGLRQVEVLVRGPGAGREAAIRALQTSGITVTSIRDVTPIPHNGCRPPKRRRI